MSEQPKEDDVIFAEAVKDVKPLPPHNLAEVWRPAIRSAPVVGHSSGSDGINDAVGEGEGAFVKDGIRWSTLRKMMSAEIPAEDELDLHGYSVPQAETRLQAFLSRRRSDHQRIVRVIHGKGLGSPGQKSILKKAVYLWLYQSDLVLAACPAGPKDGGSGAVHVLLKRRRIIGGKTGSPPRRS